MEMLHAYIYLCLLSFLGGCRASAYVPLKSRAAPIALNVSSATTSTVRPITGNWISFSIEFSYMFDFFGNISHPNKLSHQLLQNLHDLSGAYSVVRAGGTTANRAEFVASQKQPVNNTYSTPGADQPNHVYIGPSWYESFQTAPKGTQYVYCVNYRDNTTQGVNNTISEGQRVWKALGETLYAFELGNEIEGWNKVGRTPNWSPELYVKDYLNYTKLFDQYVFGPDKNKVEPRFQAGTFQGSGGAKITPGWNSVNVLQLGINNNSQIRSISQHDYMGSNCASRTEVATLRANLLNHTNVINRVYPHRIMSPVVQNDFKVSYVLGETNSISCQGQDMVSNVFGSALWYLDYNLYVAAETSVARMDFHMGTPYRYSLWQPFDDQPDKTGNLSALIRPSYYGALMLAQALKGGKKVVSLVQQESFVAYGLYGGTDSKLSGIVAVNMNEYNQTASAVARPSVTLSLPESVTKGANVQVRRLTAPGADVKTGETLAGRTVDKSGVITGTEVVEALVSGGVVLKSSEAVLLSFVGAS